ncbi:EscS/YscS/HrcS family type III secretion system export apparatus protein [Trinickia acidisoli]|uniref:EscS/YscS/HrcS family type III secretion system export apparatus protein n=1 Tax=Trinickia acidisoli TaxID=2767482 RepID=UPI001A8C39AD|nr:flagellar biosynthetic protein FliQ [Trinickia acidisoli]
MPESLVLFQQALLFAFKVSVALALAASCAGIAISLALSVFQIQDQTLPFAVKLVVVGLAVVITGRAVGLELVRMVDQVFELASVPLA